MTKVIATSVHLITISVAGKGCRCSMQFRNRSTQFKMPDYTCYDGKYVAFCFFAVNAFYLTAMAILFLYNRSTNINQRYETQESNVYVVAPPKGEGEYSITIKEAFKLWQLEGNALIDLRHGFHFWMRLDEFLFFPAQYLQISSNVIILKSLGKSLNLAFLFHLQKFRKVPRFCTPRYQNAEEEAKTDLLTCLASPQVKI